jgi:FKBP-type peptidyl-prolyl cis-trans isomerase SlyD
MKITKDCVVTLHYSVVDSQNYPLDPGDEPLVYLHGGYEDIFEKVEQALEGKEVGESIAVKLSPKESFGEYDQNLLVAQPRSDFDERVHVGEQFEEIVEDEVGEDESILYIVKEVTQDHVILDGNHPFAGLDLIFRATIQDVRKATPQEIQERYAR